VHETLDGGLEVNMKDKIEQIIEDVMALPDNRHLVYCDGSPECTTLDGLTTEDVILLARHLCTTKAALAAAEGGLNTIQIYTYGHGHDGKGAEYCSSCQ